MTTRQMEQATGVNHRTLARWLLKAGIAARSPGESIKTSVLRDRAWLESQYVARDKSAEQISKETGIAPATVRRWLRYHGIAIRSTNAGRKFGPDVVANMSASKKGRQIGDKNPNWRGGYVDKTKRERVSYAHKAWSKAVRERDGRCVKCGSGNRLHAHHVKSWHKHPELRYDVANGVTLCARCHQAAHGFPFPSWVLGKTSTSAGQPTG